METMRGFVRAYSAIFDALHAIRAFYMAHLEYAEESREMTEEYKLEIRKTSKDGRDKLYKTLN